MNANPNGTDGILTTDDGLNPSKSDGIPAETDGILATEGVSITFLIPKSLRLLIMRLHRRIYYIKHDAPNVSDGQDVLGAEAEVNACEQHPQPQEEYMDFLHLTNMPNSIPPRARPTTYPWPAIL